MKKFEFKLETVLQVKIRANEECQRQLYNAEVARQDAQTQLTRSRARLDEATRDYECSLRQRFDQGWAYMFHQYSVWLMQKIKEDGWRLKKAEREVDEARQRLLDATRERKILDKLKDQAYQKYLADALHEEINFLDELGTERFARKNREIQEGY